MHAILAGGLVVGNPVQPRQPAKSRVDHHTITLTPRLEENPSHYVLGIGLVHTPGKKPAANPLEPVVSIRPLHRRHPRDEFHTLLFRRREKCCKQRRARRLR
jgi:hypothetical protein